MTGSDDLSETRNLVEEINMRTKQLPLTKQDSYANAIYNSATRAQQARKGIKKQGSYEQAVESGAKNQAQFITVSLMIPHFSSFLEGVPS